MKKYQIEITETLQRIITVEAINLENALHTVRQQYKNEEIVLNENDYIDTEFCEFTN